MRLVLEMNDIPKRKQITAEEAEEFIQDMEKRLKILSGDEAKNLEATINQFKMMLAGMRNGTIKVFQHIPTRIDHV
jgi:polyhydroxyalkanoate synthesis regulator phasin